jgi:Asp-tRNA(Asn)/Glu-tRNA(Gln) amidotransferase A subunit family amidase
MVSELATSVRAGKVGAEELVRLAIARIEDLDRKLNAVVALRADEAIAEAKSLDERLRHDRASSLPLAGLPLLVKDTEDVAGMKTTCGSLLLADSAPLGEDGPVVARLRAAGAIVVGKTNVPEFAFEAYTCNRLFGATRNPWSLDWSPGGSSGGSAAALAAGLAPLATGTDAGGSIRVPASYCGLVGLKPTNGLVVRDRVLTYLELQTGGALATSVADASLLLELIATVPISKAKPAGAAKLPRRIVAAGRVVDWGPLPQEIDRAFGAVLGTLENDLDTPVEFVDSGLLPKEPNADEDWFTITQVEQSWALGRETIEQQAELFDLAFLEQLRLGLGVDVATYVAARSRCFTYARELDQLLGDDGLLITPTIALEGILCDGRLLGNERPGSPPEVCNTMVANMTGHPALSLPAGLLPNGLPFGIQMIAPRFREDLLFAAGGLWEQHNPWPHSAPGYEPFEGAD